jgi:hypothetical protein
MKRLAAECAVLSAIFSDLLALRCSVRCSQRRMKGILDLLH